MLIKLWLDKALKGLTNRDDIERHLRDVSLSVTDNFLNNGLERCEISNSNQLPNWQLFLILLLITLQTFNSNSDDTNFQLFVLILNSTISM